MDPLEQFLVDSQYGIGAHSDPHDDRDYKYSEYLAALGAAPQIDWEKGWDIRNYLGADFNVKNQWTSMSCVGQGWSYELWVLLIADLMVRYNMDLAQLRSVHPELVDEVSAKAVYSQITLGYGQGATIRDGAMLGLKFGRLYESQVPSYYDGAKNNVAGPMTDESWMVDKKWLSPQATALAALMKGKQARVVDTIDMDTVATAIMQNLGVVGGVIGSNGHGWGSEEGPTPPSPGDQLWGHCLCYLAFGTDEKGKFIATPNSWGQITSRPMGPWQKGYPPGYGWQKLRANYFVPQWQFNPWTFTDIPSEVAPNPAPLVQQVAPFDVNQPILYGMRNPLVLKLQQALVKLGYLDAKYTTGYYGDLTAGAVLKFQTDKQVDTMVVLNSLKGRACRVKTLTALNAALTK